MDKPPTRAHPAAVPGGTACRLCDIGPCGADRREYVPTIGQPAHRRRFPDGRVGVAMGWFVGMLAGAVIGTGTWLLAIGPVEPGRHAEKRVETGGADDEPVPGLRPTSAPGDAGTDEGEPEIRPPVQRGPEDFYRAPPRERKLRDKMYA